MKDASPGNEKNDKKGGERNNNGHSSLKDPKEGEEREWTTDIEEVWFAVRALILLLKDKH